MSGHYGNDSATLLNLTIVDVNVEKNYILIKGGIPGAKKSIVVIRSAVKDVKAKGVKSLLDRTPAPAPVVEEAPVVEAEVAAPAEEKAE